uniref:TNFR-Cys domain-containing protein n=1 Tax=Guillardia theta TaxID=55529 RepID=A0A7S4N9U0_GUITH|mmetsp:Transcript_18622/g.61166  ORF Transcript_18622/g.61166 Transcript_18622/m.61166 type:complete len:1350 (+) Transcript_18622:75-4124(+)
MSSFTFPSSFRVSLLFLLIAYGRNTIQCPTTISDEGLVASGYAISTSDLLISSSAQKTQGVLSLSQFNFSSPEYAGEALASGKISVTVTCAHVSNSGCTGASTVNSTCLGCAGTVSVSVSGSGAYVSSGNCSGCSCSDAGVVSTPATTYNVSYNSSMDNCSAADCSCDANGVASGNCGCACIPTVCSCQCTQNSCGHTVSSDSKTFTATGGGTCQVSASCSAGFYDGATYTGYNSVSPSLLRSSQVLPGTYLQNTVPTASSGQLYFSSLTVYNTIAKSSILSIVFAAGSSGINVSSSSFECWPYYFSVKQYSDSSKNYLTSQQFTTDQSANLGNYMVILLDKQSNTIDTVYESDAFTAQFSLVTGDGFDSSTQPTPTKYSVLSSSDLLLTDASNAAISNNLVTLSNSSTAVNIFVANQVGLYFLVLVEVSSAFTKSIFLGATALQTPFSINAGNVNISYGSSKLVLPPTDPQVLLLDAVGSNDTKSSSGLPLPLYVQFQTSDYQILDNAKCVQCVQARLVKCSNSVPTQFFVEQDCTAVNQAQCATSNQDGSKCASAGYTSSNSFLDTLGGTTIANLENGTAVFTDLAVHFVAGYGYKLQFTLNAGGRYTTSSVVASSQSQNGQIFVPSVGSFFVRPYNLNILQEIGGDGVDINGDYVPDGVGVGIPFRVQPAVTIAGNGYSFDKNWGQHGWLPIRSQIVSSSCGGDCSKYNMTLYGSSTGASTYESEFLMWSSYSGFIGSPNRNVRLAYDSSIGNVGLLWQDLTIKNAQQQAVLNVLLSFACGPSTNISSISTTSTMITYFDLFSAPSPPSNLKVSDYGSLGFRVEFDPGLISREAPLSGFLLEFDVCQQEKDVSCSTVENQFYSGLGFSTPVTSVLGSGLDLGGGYTQEAFIIVDSSTSTDNVTISAVNVTMGIQRTIYPGDQLVFSFASLQSKLLASFNPNCTLQGVDSQKFKISSYNSTTSVIVLTIQDGFYLVWGSMVQFQFPDTCMISGMPSPPFGQTLLQIPVIGVNSQVQFDNCKGNSSCLAAKTVMLPSIQDANSMDLDWSGQLQYGSTGAPCATTLASTSSYMFPSNRICSTGDSGSNGRPVGFSFASSARTSGSQFMDSNAACRSSQAQSNPCTLSIGQSWTVGIEIMYHWNGYVTNQSIWEDPQIELWFTTEQGIFVGDILRFTIPSLVQQQPSASGTCYTFHEAGSQQIGFNTIYQNASFPNSSFLSECEIFKTEVTFDYGNVLQQNWETHFDNKASTFQIYVGSPVLPGAMMNVKINGFRNTQAMNYSQNAIGEVIRGKRTTLVLSQNSIKASYSSISGNPINGYTESRSQDLNLGDIVSFRIYAHNGRFKSAPI